MPMLPNGVNPNGNQPLQYGQGSPAKVSIPNDTKLSIPTVTAEMTRNSGKIGPDHDLNPAWSPVESGEILKGIEDHQGGDEKFWAKK